MAEFEAMVGSKLRLFSLCGWARIFAGVVLSALMCAVTPIASAGEFPQWEAGVGLSLIRFPDYRGSNEFKTYAFPIPYYVYRGERIKVDRESVRGQFFKTDRMELDFSFNGTVPIKSKDNAAREGMPDIKATLEFGPSLNTTLWRTEDKRQQLVLRLPMRAVVGSDFKKFEDSGWVSHPVLNLDMKNFADTGWNLGMLGGPLYLSQRYNQRLYGVAPEYATPTRRAYQAKGGYGGSNFLVGVSKRFDRFWVGAFAKYDSLSGASFADSPLVKKQQYASVGLAMSWVFAVSEKRVEAND
jgi:MipA family protein